MIDIPLLIWILNYEPTMNQCIIVGGVIGILSGTREWIQLIKLFK